MLTPVANPLLLPAECSLSCCTYNIADYSEQSLAELDIALPERLLTAVTKRRVEYLAGRYCARSALQTLGCAALPQLDPQHRAPIWPTGIIGAITHSHGFAAAAVADVNVVRAIGIDSEFLIKSKTANSVASHILLPTETYLDNQSLVSSEQQYLTLIFSAKESIFKCINPLVNQYFNFKDAQITLSNSQPGRFEFRLLKDLNEEFRSGFSAVGQYTLAGDFVHTAVVLYHS